MLEKIKNFFRGLFECPDRVSILVETEPVECSDKEEAACAPVNFVAHNCTPEAKKAEPKAPATTKPCNAEDAPKAKPRRKYTKRKKKEN